ncbi:MAG: inositol phosphate phosphatase SopB [Noviherbaspirillum sp.]
MAGALDRWMDGFVEHLPDALESDRDRNKDVLETWDTLHLLLGQRREYLSGISGSCPFSRNKMYAAKAQMVQSAWEVLDKARKEVESKEAKADPGKNQMWKALGEACQRLESRRDALDAAAKDPANVKIADPKAVIGAKPLTSLWDRIFHRNTVREQRRKLGEAVAALALEAKGEVALDLKEFNEQSLMEGVVRKALEQAGLSRTHDAAALYARAHKHILNTSQDAWQPIVQEVVVESSAPDPAPDRAPWLARFVNAIVPAVNFCKGFGHYEKDGVRGINSHCTTEYRHAANLARTETRDAAGQVVFSAYRAATLSAYHITPETLRGLPDQEVQAMLEYLLPPKRQHTSTGALLTHDSQLPKLRFIQKRIRPDDEPEEQDNALRYRAGGMEITITSEREHKRQIASLIRQARKDGKLCAKLRQQAANNRAQEALAGMVQDDPVLMEQIRQGKTTIEGLCVSSVSLVTPDAVNLTGELAMQQEQFAAWDAVLRQGATAEGVSVRVMIPTGETDGQNQPILEGKTVKLKEPQVLAFDFGVNSGAVGDTGWIPGAGGWDWADRHNAQGFAILFGKNGNDQDSVFSKRYASLVGQRDALRAKLSNADSRVKLAERRQMDERLQLLDRQIEPARDLKRQIQQMWQDKSYRKAGNEPYKMVSRLMVLGSILGIKMVFNCKSGKDRTGETDAEAKYLASRIARGIGVHEPDAELPEAEFRNRYAFVARSGNLEMQAYNTGLAGYKLEGVKALYRQMGNSVAEFKGLSAYTRS